MYSSNYVRSKVTPQLRDRHLTILTSGGRPVCPESDRLALQPLRRAKKSIIQSLPRIGLFSSSILSTPWTQHQTAQQRTGQTTGGNLELSENPQPSSVYWTQEASFGFIFIVS